MTDLSLTVRQILRKPRVSALLAMSLGMGLVACEGGQLSETGDFGGRGSGNPNTQLQPATDIIERKVPVVNPDRNAYFGDLHVHTSYSFDAFTFGNTNTPYDAYRYARGEALTHPVGYDIQLQTPLDFYAVTDHAMFLGLVRAAADTSTEFSKYDISEPLHNINAPDNKGVLSLITRMTNFSGFVPNTLAGILDGTIDEDVAMDVSRRAWLDIIDAAEQFNDPGRFTTFVGYEYTTSSDDRGNLHRNVIFQGSDKLPALPFSRLNSQNPEGLWDWMDDLRGQGIESLAIPHNSNGSNGQMFKLEDWAGNPLDDDYAVQRMRNEPLVEITQIKGTSDTHPLLSPNDEWADFEIYGLRVGTQLPSQPNGSYVRQALINGLALEQQGVQNPFQFGLAGASDTHVAASSVDEATYFSKVGLIDGEPMGRGSIPVSFLYGTALKFYDGSLVTSVEGKNYVASFGFESWSASGLTGVWAEENTREAIYAAFRRKETFATSGPRIKVRFFASNAFEQDIVDNTDIVSLAYQQGVAMGDELASEGGPPQFLVWAASDPLSAALQRVQIVKGYVKDGEGIERVYDVACSDGAVPDRDSHRCPDNGAQVNLADCSITADVGDAEIIAEWRDPDYDPEEDAVYYLRVLENPTCRWSTWDAIREGEQPRADLPKTIQERAWSSPIWVRAVDNAEG